jgi:hypothetical protein
MNRRAVALTFVALVEICSPARAGSDSDALEMFGLIGHWAAECGAPPTPTNPHVRFIASDGWGPIYQVSMGNPQVDSAFAIRQVSLIGQDQISLSLSLGVVNFASTILKKTNGQVRPFESTLGTGQVTIHEGLLTKTGAETQWLQQRATEKLG